MFMRLVESSDPSEVTNYQASWHLRERLSLANALCLALQRTRGSNDGMPAGVTFSLLVRWVRERYPTNGPEVDPRDGLERMLVPIGDEHVMRNCARPRT